MKKLTASLLIFCLLSVVSLSTASAKPCGNGYIRDDYVCHKGGDGGDGADGETVAIVLGVIGLSAVLIGLIVWGAQSQHSTATNTITPPPEVDLFPTATVNVSDTTGTLGLQWIW